MTNESMMTPREIVSELDKYIVGQNAAKKAVAVALRNRWRRARVAEPLHSEISPKKTRHDVVSVRICAPGVWTKRRWKRTWKRRDPLSTYSPPRGWTTWKRSCRVFLKR